MPQVVETLIRQTFTLKDPLESLGRTFGIQWAATQVCEDKAALNPKIGHSCPLTFQILTLTMLLQRAYCDKG